MSQPSSIAMAVMHAFTIESLHVQIHDYLAKYPGYTLTQVIHRSIDEFWIIIQKA